MGDWLWAGNSLHCQWERSGALAPEGPTILPTPPSFPVPTEVGSQTGNVVGVLAQLQALLHFPPHLKVLQFTADPFRTYPPTKPAPTVSADDTEDVEGKETPLCLTELPISLCPGVALCLLLLSCA